MYLLKTTQLSSGFFFTCILYTYNGGGLKICVKIFKNSNQIPKKVLLNNLGPNNYYVKNIRNNLKPEMYKYLI